jgi:hypothetical protein
MREQRITLDSATLTDPTVLEELDWYRREATPRPERQAIHAHVPACFWSFVNCWRDVLKNGVCDHSIKELCRLFVLISIKCATAARVGVLL